MRLVVREIEAEKLVEQGLLKEEKKKEVQDSYLEKIAKYIPGEILFLYLGIDGWIKGNPGVIPFELYLAIFFFGMLVLTPGYMWRNASTKKLGLPINHMILSPIAFFVWIYAIGGPFSFLAGYSSAIAAGIVLPISTVSLPLFEFFITKTQERYDKHKKSKK